MECFFSHDWWTKFVSLWNREPFHNHLSGLGGVVFGLIGNNNAPEVVVVWDNEGLASLQQVVKGEFVKFSATEENWKDFINGYINATDSLLKGNIHFEGRIGKITPYSIHFNLVAVVARNLI